MPIDTKHSEDYAAGQDAFDRGLNLADKSGHIIRNEWDAGWHDAHARLTRSMLERYKK